jgi:hypothetical protein
MDYREVRSPSGRFVPSAWHGHTMPRRLLAGCLERSDLKAIMSCYSEYVDFVASTVIQRWGRDNGRQWPARLRIC